MSDNNISKEKLDENIEIAIKHEEYLKLYVLSSGQRPNTKDSSKIIQNKEFELFLDDLDKEFKEIDQYK